MMMRLAAHTWLVGLLFVNANAVCADIVVFDFGNGSSANNSQGGGLGNWDPFPAGNALTLLSAGSVSTTLSSLQMTLSGSTTDGNSIDDETWGITREGIGIHSDGLSNAKSRRLDGTIGEMITFSFGKDVILTSLRLGSAGVGDTVTVTPAGGAAITIVNSGQGATNDYFLDSNGDGSGVFTMVSAGTDIAFTTTAGDVLFNEITVTTAIPEPAVLLFCGIAISAMGLRRRRIR